MVPPGSQHQSVEPPGLPQPFIPKFITPYTTAGSPGLTAIFLVTYSPLIVIVLGTGQRVLTFSS